MLIGKQITGFKFEEKDYPEIGWIEEMDLLIGSVGKIIMENKFLKCYEVDFGNDQVWHYPAKEIRKYLL